MTKVYRYRGGYGHSTPAATVGNALEKIEAQYGAITSEAFLEYSRPEDADTHSMFEWNDTAAAEKFRLGQATRIVNSIEVTFIYEKSGRKEITVNGFVNTNQRGKGQKGVFVSVEAARNDQQKWEQVMQNALNELLAFKRKYANLKEFGSLFAEVERIEAAMTA